MLSRFSFTREKHYFFAQTFSVDAEDASTEPQMELIDRQYGEFIKRKINEIQKSQFCAF